MTDDPENTTLAIRATLTEELGVPQLPGEPFRWYNRFVMHYLPLGMTRNLRRAYHHYVDANEKDPAKAARKKSYTAVSAAWVKASIGYNWKERADAFDLKVREEALAVVKEAQLRLVELLPQAVETLANSLHDDDSRIRIKAACEILDRTGIAKITVSEHRGVMGVVSAQPSAVDLGGMTDEQLHEWLRDLSETLVKTLNTPTPVDAVFIDRD